MHTASFLLSSSYDFINNNSKPARSLLTLRELKIKTNTFYYENFHTYEETEQNNEPSSIP